MSRTAVQPSPPEIPGLRYIEELGRGGYSIVYRYEEMHPNRQVAVKVPKDVGSDEAVRQQFAHEADVMAKLGNHPNIGQVFASAVSTDGTPYLKMAYYPGHNLAERAAGGRLSVPEVVGIGIRIADAVEAAHRAGIVHRDIKPANILIDEYGAPRLTDFGIAGRLITADEQDDIALSVPWSPPEIIRGESGGVASDVYSLGATLWHLLVGHSPAVVAGGDNSRPALEHRILTEPPPGTGRSDVPAALADLLSQALAKSPAARPRTARAFATVLREIERGLERSATDTIRRRNDVAETSRPSRLRADLTNTVLRPRREPPSEPLASATSPRQPAAWVPPNPPAPPPRPVPPEPLETVRKATSTADHDPVDAATGDQPGAGPRRTLVWAAAVGVIGVVAVAVVAATVNASGTPAGPRTAGTGAPALNQDAGAMGDNAPPGVPTVTATRVDPATVRFTWTYSAPLGSDTFSWRTQDGKQSGTAKTASVDLPDPAGTTVCLQVKVVRADGSHATADWSPTGCGS